jgi:hypothetical protein
MQVTKWESCVRREMEKGQEQKCWPMGMRGITVDRKAVNG